MTEPLEDPAPQPDSVERHAVNGAVWVTAEMLGVQGTSFIVFATIAHFVRPRDFGLISICYFAVQSLEMLILYNVATVAFRRRYVIAREFTTAFWITLGLSILLFLGLFSVAGWAERLFNAPGLAPILRAMSIILLFMGLSRTHEAWLMRHFQFKSLVIRGIAGAVLGGVTGVVLAMKGFGVNALVAQQIVTSVISTTLLWMACPWRPSFHISGPAAKDIVMFMFRMLPNNIVSAVNQNCDTFLVAFFFGPAGAGFYNVGKRVKLALQLVAGNPISAIGLPALAEIQDDPARLRAGALRSITIICAVCSPIFFGASAVAKIAVIVVFGQYWEGSIPVMQLLSLGGLAAVILSFNDNIFILKDRPAWCLWVSLSYASLAVIALLILAKLRINSLALPFVLPYIVVLPLSLTLMSKRLGLKLRDITAAILPGLTSAAVMLVIVNMAAEHLSGRINIIRLGALCSLGMVTYMGILFCAWRKTALLLLTILRQLRARKAAAAIAS
jgi:O-antigen/teichoic acid export membrane protein